MRTLIKLAVIVFFAIFTAVSTTALAEQKPVEVTATVYTPCYGFVRMTTPNEGKTYDINFSWRSDSLTYAVLQEVNLKVGVKNPDGTTSIQGENVGEQILTAFRNPIPSDFEGSPSKFLIVKDGRSYIYNPASGQGQLQR
ncbi:MAG: hypothetical protein WCV55_02245 [Candidatus Paceibacterota bacterium]